MSINTYSTLNWNYSSSREWQYRDRAETFRCGIHNTEYSFATGSHGIMRKEPSVKLVREGRFVAEVDVTLIETSNPWSPYLSLEDARKLEAVRKARRSGDLAAAAKLGRVYEMKPVAAEWRANRNAKWPTKRTERGTRHESA